MRARRQTSAPKGAIVALMLSWAGLAAYSARALDQTAQGGKCAP